MVRVHQARGPEALDLWLCPSCARALEVEANTPSFGPTVGELLGSLLADHGARACPACATSFRSIRQTGRVGCSECFRVFRARIQQLLEQKGLADPHVGRYPARLHSYKRLLVDRESLRRELEEAVHREDYEAAASLRDRMQGMEESRDGRL